MTLTLGLASLFLAFLCAIYGAVVALIAAPRKATAWVESARNAAMLTWPLITLAALSIIIMLVKGQYDVEYVTHVSSRAMPWYLKVTALWGGQAGSLLFWSWLMSAFTSAAMLRRWDRDRSMMPYVIAASMITLAFFLSLSLFVENPFQRLWQNEITGEIGPALLQPANSSLFTPLDGNGLNPLLRHPGMIIHPPMLYLGFVSFIIPYAFAIAALATGRTDDEWIRTTRRWTLVAWLFLSLGLILGGRWAYDVLGWGGYWGWDPVENAALLPWLTGTAFLHSVMIQEKRGMLKVWNMILIISTYSLVILGTFLTRSGVLSSVHAFAQSAIGPLFFAFIGITFAISMGLLFHRWDSLKSETQLDSLLSREAAFLLNNLLFLGVAFATLWGTLFPIISELVTGQKVTVGPPFYNQVNGPLLAAIVLLMGVAPLVAWRKASARSLGRLMWIPAVLTLVALVAFYLLGARSFGALLGYGIATFVGLTTLSEFARGVRARMRLGENPALALINLAARNRRRYGGYVIHLGVVVMAFGVVGSYMFQQETQATLNRGETLSLGGFTMKFDSVAQFNTDDRREVTRATVSVFDAGGSPVGVLHPRRDFFLDSGQPMTIPGVRSTLGEDFYVLLVDWQPISSNSATFKIYVNPLINLVWWGGIIFIIGTLVAAWPDAAEEKRYVSAPAGVATRSVGAD
ncbi:MAG: heme lyase CcmF/NrfE family subunit [Chloroflexi bacterium]|nr:heme lyase CcmF/NrfE family subunit [Chloroflexota bacterium]